MTNVKVYSTQTCPWCVKAKQFLEENNVEFENFDVSVDQKAAEEMITASGQRGVPVIDIDGTILVGFDQEAISKALEL